MKNLCFAGGFASDLRAVRFAIGEGESFALARFGDGERAILEGRPITIDKPHEQWTNPDEQFRSDLWASLTYGRPGWHVGISCPCCDQASYDWYSVRRLVPGTRVTFANIFANANGQEAYRLFESLMNSGRNILVSSHPRADVVVSTSCVSTAAVDEAIERLRIVSGATVDGPFLPLLLACGPAANVIAWKVFHRKLHLGPILDIGSCLDPLLHGQPTRGYHDPNHPNAKQECHW